MSIDLRPAFVVERGAAMNTAGQPVYVVQERLTKVAGAYGARGATGSGLHEEGALTDEAFTAEKKEIIGL
jgi:hypothetical protein